MKLRNLLLVMLGFLLLSPSPLFSEGEAERAQVPGPAHALDLSSLVREALERNPEIEAARRAVQAKRACVPQAALGINSASISRPQESATSLRWRSSAKLHRGLLAKVTGTLIIDGAGVEFRPDKGSSIRWPFVEIQTLYIQARRITVTGYEKRGRLRTGTKQFRFDLGTDLPAAVAAELVKSVGRPVRNGNPQPEASSIATLPAHHRTGFGGTKSNGILRFREEGIDYVTKGDQDSRSWRWADIQTITNQDRYHLIVFGYRETYSFDLKQPLPPGLYDRLTDEVYDHNVKDLRGSVKAQPESSR